MQHPFPSSTRCPAVRHPFAPCDGSPTVRLGCPGGGIQRVLLPRGRWPCQQRPPSGCVGPQGPEAARPISGVVGLRGGEDALDTMSALSPTSAGSATVLPTPPRRLFPLCPIHYGTARSPS